MLSKISQNEFFSSKHFFAQNPSQKLNIDKYQEYLSFTSLLIQGFTDNKDVLYIAKIILDKLIDQLTLQQLQSLAQKDEFFIKHIMIISLRVNKQISQEDILEMEENHNHDFEPSDDDLLFVNKIKIYEDEIKDIISPFTYLNNSKSSIGVKMANKMQMILEYMISDHRFYMINSGLLYGMSLKWLLLNQHKLICEQLQIFLSYFSQEEQEKTLKKIEQMMQQINNI